MIRAMWSRLADASLGPSERALADQAIERFIELCEPALTRSAATR